MKMRMSKNLSDGAVSSLYTRVFNFSENIDENLKKTKVTDLLKKDETVYDTTKTNINIAPLLLRRLYETYFIEDSKSQIKLNYK